MATNPYRYSSALVPTTYPAQGTTYPPQGSPATPVLPTLAGPLQFEPVTNPVTNPAAPILPTLATRPLLPIRPPVLEEDSGDGYRTGEGGGSPWENFAEWSNLGQEKQQQVIDRLEGVMKWAGPVGTAASLLAPFPFGPVIGAAGTFIGQRAAKDLYGMQHGDISDWYKSQWSFLDAFNPFGGATSAEQLSRNITNFESSVLASDRDALPEAQAGWKTDAPWYFRGRSGLGIPDDIQIEYGGSRSEGEIRDLIDKARERERQERIAYGDDWTGSGGPPVPEIRRTGSEGWQYLDLTDQQQEVFDQVAQREQEALAYRDDWKMGSGDAPVPEIRRQPEAIIAQREIMDQIPHMLSPEDKAKRDEAWDRAAQLIEQTVTLDWDEGGGWEEAEESAAAETEALDEMEGGENYGDFNTGGPVIKRRGFGETATSPLAAGSFIDKPLYDRAVDTSPTYRRW
jgi:hypothetical protein